ncbi:MAG TPA: PilZ domain-containing protein [Dongiaceae bacterium]|nr:PilZ domain-containing protein [Dongiaceae bacterium]
MAINTNHLKPGGYAKQRRSQRILLCIPVTVSGQLAHGATFSERTNTVVINAHGALLELRQTVVVGQALLLKHLGTGEELPCRVIDINPAGHVPEVGVESDSPCAHFWRVAFPPADWSPRGPEAKRFDSMAPATAKK